MRRQGGDNECVGSPLLKELFQHVSDKGRPLAKLKSEVKLVLGNARTSALLLPGWRRLLLRQLQAAHAPRPGSLLGLPVPKLISITME